MATNTTAPAKPVRHPQGAKPTAELNRKKRSQDPGAPNVSKGVMDRLRG